MKKTCALLRKYSDLATTLLGLVISSLIILFSHNPGLTSEQNKAKILGLLIALEAYLVNKNKDEDTDTFTGVKEIVAQNSFIQQYKDKLISIVPADRVENAKIAIPLLLECCQEYNVTSKFHIAYIIATVSHESAFRPIKEKRANPTKQPSLYQIQNRYWDTGFYGRGYIQITWRENYARLSQALGYDNLFVENPDIVLEPKISAKITVLGMRDGLFTGKKLSDFNLAVNDKKEVISYDFYNARRIVNGLDKADLIKSYAEHYLQAFR